MKYSKAMRFITETVQGDDGYHTLSRHELRQLTRQLDAMEALAENKSPKDTDAAHVLKLESVGKQLLEKRNKAKEIIEQRTSETLQGIDRQIRQSLNMKHTPFANEVRSALRSMSSTGRARAIDSAIKNKDGGFFEAIEEAPAMLSGIDKKMQKESVTRFMQAHAPDLLAKSEAVLESFRASLDALDVPVRAVREGVNPDALQGIKAAEERHLQAQRAFDQNE